MLTWQSACHKPKPWNGSIVDILPILAHGISPLQQQCSQTGFVVVGHHCKHLQPLLVSTALCQSCTKYITEAQGLSFNARSAEVGSSQVHFFKQLYKNISCCRLLGRASCITDTAMCNHSNKNTAVSFSKLSLKHVVHSMYDGMSESPDLRLIQAQEGTAWYQLHRCQVHYLALWRRSKGFVYTIQKAWDPNKTHWLQNYHRTLPSQE